MIFLTTNRQITSKKFTVDRILHFNLGRRGHQIQSFHMIKTHIFDWQAGATVDDVHFTEIIIIYGKWMRSMIIYLPHQHKLKIKMKIKTKSCLKFTQKLVPMTILSLVWLFAEWNIPLRSDAINKWYSKNDGQNMSEKWFRRGRVNFVDLFLTDSNVMTVMHEQLRHFWRNVKWNHMYTCAIYPKVQWFMALIFWPKISNKNLFICSGWMY